MGKNSQSAGAWASAQPVTLKPLSLAPDAPKVGVATSVGINGHTAGSTIAVQSGALPPGMALDSATRRISGTPTVAGTYGFTLRESLGGAVGTPKDTAMSLGVALPGLAKARQPFIGQVANNCTTPNAVDAAQTKQMSWSGHRILAPYTGKLKIGFANWRAVSGNAEANGGGAATMRCSIITPRGLVRGYSSAGSDTIVGADGSTIEFEFDVQLPVGTQIFVSSYRECAGGVLYSQVSDTYVLNPDRSMIYAAASATDLTGQDRPSYSATENPRWMFLPVYIAGMTAAPSCIIYGDSRAVGVSDRMSSQDYDIGQIARALGALGVPYINASVGGESAFNFGSPQPGTGTNSVKRRSLAQFASHQVFQFGINDLNADASVTATYTTRALALLDQTKPIIITTAPPFNTSTDAFVTTANQTVHANEATRVTENNRRRSLAGVVCWDVADAVECNAAGAKTRNGGRWGCITATGDLGAAGRAITADGIHENREGNIFIRDSGAIRARALA